MTFARFWRGRWAKLAGLAALCLGLMLCFSGCEAIGFYRQAVAGQYEILAHQKPVKDLMTDPATKPELKARFAQIEKIRQFALTELKLPAGKSYLKYVDLHRPYVVWNVNVAPPLSLDPVTWWFPIVGEASYRGYFSEENARRYAAGWEKKGFDIYVDGVDAYSTLGWFPDPLLNTFINQPDADLAELIFHELGHRRLFINGDTDFNEAFAMEVAAEGLRRWFAAFPDATARRKHEEEQGRERQFVQMVMATRGDLEAVYADAQLSDAVKTRRKEEIVAKLRSAYAAVKQTWGGYTGYDHWFSEPINNAKLNTISAYYDLVPAFEGLLHIQGGDLEKFYNAVADLGKLPLERRHEALRKFASPPQVSR